MPHAKRNRAVCRVGRGRGVPMRLARGIAKKYGLTHIVILTADDKQRRSRIIYWAGSEAKATQVAPFCEKLATELGWSIVYDWDCSGVRRLKTRIKELEAALAQIIDGEPDAIGLARSAGKFPDESDGSENNGAWIFYPQGKFNPSNVRK